MTAPEHPIRKAEIHVFTQISGVNAGAKFIARLHPYDAWPIFFKGETFDEAHSRATAFIVDVLDKHESAYVARKLAAEKARKAKAIK